eukprot:Clim_evm38s151 gene=Clim_evmTU38s151
MAEDLQQTILQTLDSQGNVDSTISLAQSAGVDHQVMVGALKSLENAFEGLVLSDTKKETRWTLTAEGQQIAAEGSHEKRVWDAVGAAGMAQSDLMKLGPWAKVGMAKAMQAKWVSIDKSGGAPVIKRSMDSVTTDPVRDLCQKVAAGQPVADGELKDMKKRKLVAQENITFFSVAKGPNFTTKLEKPETELTSDMLANGEWKSKTFKPYNFDAMGVPVETGHLHPLMKVRQEFREIFLEMGFEEMNTQQYVESSFWNFDTLYVPQKHPARDDHDTFFLKDPERSNEFPEDYLKRVHNTHENGDYGSIGYRAPWHREETERNVLRTHTTAISARMLYKMGQEQPFRGRKLFSIDRVFRNETLDATHLAEFHQIEGVVADYGITLAHLIGVLQKFYERLGLGQLRFKPAYNPYTEPSMEIFAYHPGLKKWVEVGNSGVFRPEMVEPMGIPKEVSVLGWGLSLERPTMIKYGISNIRELMGYKVNLDMVMQSPLCRLDKH